VCKILVLLPVDFWWIATVFWVEMKISTAQLSGKKAHDRKHRSHATLGMMNGQPSRRIPNMGCVFWAYLGAQLGL